MGIVMKKLLLGVIALVVLNAGSAALAADMPVKAPVYKAPPPPPMFNWTGGYVGGFVGGAWTKNVTSHDPTETVSNGNLPVGFPYDCPAPGAPFFGAVCQDSYRLNASVIAGGTLGYNWQAAGSPYVFGVEGEVGYMRLTGSGVDNFTAGLPCSLVGPFNLPPSQCNTFFSTKIGDWYAAVTARFGIAWDRVLLYAKLGAAFTEVRTSVSDTCSVAPCGAGLLLANGDHVTVGVAAGAGLEYALTDNWSIKGEYLYVGIDRTVSACGVQSNPAVPASFGATFCSNTDVHGVHTAKFGVNYHFGGPVVAKY
jgi:outer membrane immunogenic protein